MSHDTRAQPSGKALAGLALAALGVVYGDIGTSPLYALKECFSGPHGVVPTRENVLGVLSLVFWSLNLLVSIKYIGFMMRADNKGEGGILALLALLRPLKASGGRRALLIGAGVFGATLLYGDGIITPAISVLGAMEGLSVVSPPLQHWVTPLSALIILALFLVQRHGTARVGRWFGPVTTVWFICIAVIGIRGIAQDPSVLWALSPTHAVEIFIRDPKRAFILLAAVVLVVTGGEALYADMGHFGRRPIRVAWFCMVLPALVLNYFGQGALLLDHPDAANNPFYTLAPGWFRVPLLFIATAAAIVASQALISGAYSLTQQAIQLGYTPRLTIRHTSETEKGQIYVPEVNWLLMVSCLALVFGFGDSSRLASAYGVAVTGTMATTTVLFSRVAVERLGWKPWQAISLAACLLVVELGFFTANLIKVPDGGWFPLAVAVGIFILMSTWKRGRIRLTRMLDENALPLDLFLNDVAKRIPARVPGTAVFMTSHAAGAPPVLLHHVKHNKVLHEQVILMSVKGEEVPRVDEDERITCEELGPKFWVVTARYGFMESADVPDVLNRLQAYGVHVRPMETTYYLGRETLIATRKKPKPPRREGGPRIPEMALWRKKLFIVMSRNAVTATTFFSLPPNRVVEMGAQIQF